MPTSVATQAYKKCSVCLGPSKVMGKIFCQICAWSTHHKHITWSPYERGSGQGHFDALWCNLHLYLKLFCVNIIIFYFLVLNIFCRVNFFLGPAVPWSCGFCRPVLPSQNMPVQLVPCLGLLLQIKYWNFCSTRCNI